jgi:hypothetical protein
MGHFLIPLLMVGASVVVVKLNRFLLGNAGGPRMDGPRKINFSDVHVISGHSFVVPIATGSEFPLPDYLEKLEVGESMDDFLLENSGFPFAVGLGSVVYVNPLYPNVLPYVLGLVGKLAEFELTPVLSIVELTFMSFPVFLPFILYFALALHRLAVDGAVVVAEEKMTQHEHFWEMHGL